MPSRIGVRLIERVGFPLIVKPRVRARSVGVVKVQTKAVQRHDTEVWADHFDEKGKLQTAAFA